MKRVWGFIAAVALLGATSAWAVAKGGSLYIKAKDVKLLKEPKAGSAAVMPKALEVGTEVKWNGPAKDPAFHEIEVGGKKGYVLQSVLSPSKPAVEVAESTGNLKDTKAMASSASATKGLTPAALTYAKAGGPGPEKAACQVIYVEEHNKQKQTDVALATKARELGGGK